MRITTIKRTCICTLIFIAFSGIGIAQNNPDKPNLGSEMKRLKVETVLIVNSQAIDEYPLWSPNSDYIACNIEGKGYKFRLSDIELIKGKWHGKKIGVLSTQDAYSPLTESEQKEYEKVSVFNAREVVTADGTKIELKQTDGFSISLIVTKKDESPKTLWTSEGENCHSLVISPDGNYVAYLCEMNGLLVMKIK
ncbi:MAG: hypothetical protein JWO09_1707 [Bacteroidetes bacterium]|nr:hypothetical protein [Bacteroidota bacterium]